MNDTIETVTIFRTWIEIADALKSDAERGMLYHAVCRYSMYGEEPRLQGLLHSYFTLMRPSIDKSNKRKIAQQKSSQMRLQNNSQNKSQNDLQNESQNKSQTNAHSPLQLDLQDKSQNDTARVRKTGTGTGKKREPEGSPKEAAASFADQIPDILKNPVFVERWKEWEAYRRDQRKPISKYGAKLQFKMLSQHPGEAIDILEFSMSNDYQGLFPPKNRPQRASSGNSRKDYSGV